MARTKKTVTLAGQFVYPTSTRWHMSEPQRGTAFAPDQYVYLLEGVEEEAYPPMVVLTSPTALEGFELDAEVQTQHPLARKNLPLRRVIGIITPDGDRQGKIAAPGSAGLPHWQAVTCKDDGSFNKSDIDSVLACIETRREQLERAKREAQTESSGKKRARRSVTLIDS